MLCCSPQDNLIGTLENPENGMHVYFLICVVTKRPVHGSHVGQNKLVLCALCKKKLTGIG